MKKIISFITALCLSACCAVPVFAEGSELLQEETYPNWFAYEQGDVNCDGVIDVTDLSIVAAHVKGVKPLDTTGLNEYEKARLYFIADRAFDHRIDICDVMRIAATIKGIDPIVPYKAKIDSICKKYGLQERAIIGHSMVGIHLDCYDKEAVNEIVAYAKEVDPEHKIIKIDVDE